MVVCRSHTHMLATGPALELPGILISSLTTRCCYINNSLIHVASLWWRSLSTFGMSSISAANYKIDIQLFCHLDSGLPLWYRLIPQRRTKCGIGSYWHWEFGHFRTLWPPLREDVLAASNGIVRSRKSSYLHRLQITTKLRYVPLLCGID